MKEQVCGFGILLDSQLLLDGHETAVVQGDISLWFGTDTPADRVVNTFWGDVRRFCKVHEVIGAEILLLLCLMVLCL